MSNSYRYEDNLPQTNRLYKEHTCSICLETSKVNFYYNDGIYCTPCYLRLQEERKALGCLIILISGFVVFSYATYKFLL